MSTEERTGRGGELAFTGERYTPECVREIRYEHLHRYAFARALVNGKTVLDAACGEGYGTALLAATAAAATGVDVSTEAIAHARARYRAPNLAFEAADCLQLPFDDETFESIVSLETLEHLQDQDGLLREFRRVLKPNGFLLISSPDRAVYSDQLHNRNEFHVKELYRSELEALLGAHFPAVRLWGQRLMFHSVIWRLQRPAGQDERGTGAETVPAVFLQEADAAVRTLAGPGHDPVYFVALCGSSEADLPDPDLAVSLFDDAGQSVYTHYNHEIRKNMAAGEWLAAREREVAELRSELDALKAEAHSPDGGGASARSWWRRLLG